MKVLVSGATGFVGVNIVNFLIHNGYEIIELNRNTKKFGGLSWNELDILHSKIDADIFIHLAGKAHDSSGSEESYMKINLGLTKKLFQIFLNSNSRIFIYVSSVKAVTEKTDGKLTEDWECHPKTYYGKSKNAAEKYILSSNVIGSKKIYIFRPCMIHGPGNKGNLNLLFNFVKRGYPYPFGAYRNRRSFLSIQNFCRIITDTIQNDIPSGIYNLSDDEPLTINEIIRMMGIALHKRTSILNINPRIIEFISMLGDKLRLPINSNRISKLTDNYIVDNSKIKKELRIESMPVSAREGILRTIESFIH